MIVKIRTILVAGLILTGMHLIAQHNSNHVEEENEFGFDQQRWNKIEDRWLVSQTVALVYSGKENSAAGQLVHINQNALFIYPRKGLPVGSVWHDDMMKIPLNEVDSVLLQKGGNKVLRAKQATRYYIPTPGSEGQKEFNGIKKTAVYSDTLADFRDLNVAFDNSKMMRSAFPKC